MLKLPFLSFLAITTSLAALPMFLGEEANLETNSTYITLIQEQKQAIQEVVQVLLQLLISKL